ncbi:helix-turn-helix domain-containing protein [Bradyrhizobium elkanii]|uniref:helix-turn-helix domain-containing protein n=1 Tax=Bradyrhizobium TaxID=374 RepID=UPI0027121FBC|nr:helix-turn-helix domain-containing protein [Bradyrhizobium elkanii]WLA39470.1 helix-turn-helix domain-containing protein [Bradyrhizobium elkanii]
MPSGYAAARPEVTIALSPAGVADAIGISRDVITAAIRSGALPVYECGNKRRCLVAEVEAWIRRDWPLSKQKD